MDHRIAPILNHLGILSDATRYLYLDIVVAAQALGEVCNVPQLGRVQVTNLTGSHTPPIPPCVGATCARPSIYSLKNKNNSPRNLNTLTHTHLLHLTLHTPPLLLQRQLKQLQQSKLKLLTYLLHTSLTLLKPSKLTPGMLKSLKTSEIESKFISTQAPTSHTLSPETPAHPETGPSKAVLPSPSYNKHAHVPSPHSPKPLKYGREEAHRHKIFPVQPQRAGLLHGRVNRCT